jgi:ribonuclease HI
MKKQNNSSVPASKSSIPSFAIYTDGACDPNPGRGGWAALLKTGKVEKILSGNDLKTTNNRMELTAAVEALRALNCPSVVNFYTDSNYLKRGITEWLPQWKQRKWQRKTGVLANIDLWKALDQAIVPHKITWHWVKGHGINPNNQKVDKIARQEIKKI